MYALIQIVDTEDQPIGTASIGKAQKDGLIHRIVRIMVENSKGKILLQKRANKVTWPNCWDNSAAGHVDAGEDYLEAAKRELFEEIGLDGQDLTEIGKYYTDAVYQGRMLKRFNMVYKLVTEETPSQLNPIEVTEVAWFTIEDTKKLIKTSPERVTDGLRDVINRYY